MLARQWWIKQLKGEWQFMAKKKNKILIKIDNLQLAKQLSRKMFKDATKKEQVIKDKTKYTRKSKHKEQLFS